MRIATCTRCLARAHHPGAREGISGGRRQRGEEAERPLLPHASVRSDSRQPTRIRTPAAQTTRRLTASSCAHCCPPDGSASSETESAKLATAHRSSAPGRPRHQARAWATRCTAPDALSDVVRRPGSDCDSRCRSHSQVRADNVRTTRRSPEAVLASECDLVDRRRPCADVVASINDGAVRGGDVAATALQIGLPPAGPDRIRSMATSDVGGRLNGHEGTTTRSESLAYPGSWQSSTPKPAASLMSPPHRPSLPVGGWTRADNLEERQQRRSTMRHSVRRGALPHFRSAPRPVNQRSFSCADEDVLQLGVALDRRESQLAAEAGLLEAAERRLDANRRVGVHRDGAGLDGARNAQALPTSEVQIEPLSP